MKHKTRTMAKRWLAVILCLCMIFPSAVTLVSAAEEPAAAPAHTYAKIEEDDEDDDDSAGSFKSFFKKK